MQFKKCKIKIEDSKTKKIFYIDGYTMDCALYKCDIEVAFGQEDQVSRTFPAADGFLNTSDDGDLNFLWINKKNNLPTLVHEIYHLTNRIARRCGFSEDDDNEAQAYLMGWLFKEIRKLK